MRKGALAETSRYLGVRREWIWWNGTGTFWQSRHTMAFWAAWEIVDREEHL